MSTPARPQSPVPNETTALPGSLESAAFGADPDLDRLPAPCSTRDWWTTAVVLGGQGHYARARAALDVLDRLTAGFSTHSDRVLASLSASTRASFLRQSGRHALASTWDGRALAIVGGLPGDPEAACDALTGLAADALGCGRLQLGCACWRNVGRVWMPRAGCGGRKFGSNGSPQNWRWREATSLVPADTQNAPSNCQRNRSLCGTA